MQVCTVPLFIHWPATQSIHAMVCMHNVVIVRYTQQVPTLPTSRAAEADLHARLYNDLLLKCTVHMSCV